jgi:hypothetical protein
MMSAAVRTGEWDLMAAYSSNQKTEYAQAPLSIQMVEQVLRWDGFPSVDSAPIIANNILDLIRAGATNRDFRKWCEWPDSHPCAAQLSRNWAELLFCSVSLATYSDHQRAKFPVDIEVFPYWEYFSMTSYCKKHASLDGYIARPEDPVWKDIYPPNGWMCGCSVLPIMALDVPRRKRIGRTIPNALRLQCANWLHIRPDHILEML